MGFEELSKVQRSDIGLEYDFKILCLYSKHYISILYIKVQDKIKGIEPLILLGMTKRPTLRGVFYIFIYFKRRNYSNLYNCFRSTSLI